jgi:hypothetical protein
MKRVGALLLFLALSGCQGPDQFIVNRCEDGGRANSNKSCTCFRDGIKKALDRKTYLGVADSALGHDEDWKAYVHGLNEAKRQQVAMSIVTVALACEAMPWDKLGEPFL